MQTEIIIAGFGGQGVLFGGQLLSYAAMDEGLEVTWIPSYGPEMRGGTASCTVIISDEEIGSPLTQHPHACIVMNLPSLVKYEKMIRPGGVLVINSSIIDQKSSRNDIKTVYVPGNEIAEAAGDKRTTNMVMLGGLLANLPVLPVTAVEKTLKEHMPTRHQRFVPLNINALHEGAKYLAK